MQPYHSPLESKTVSPAAVTVDEDDAVYVLWEDRTLTVYRADGTNTHRRVHLAFLGDCVMRIMRAITVTKDKRIVIIWRDYWKNETNIMVYLCNKDGKLTNRFDTGLKTKNHALKSLSATCDRKIMIVTGKDYNSSFMLHIFTEDGQLRKSVKTCSEKKFSICNIFYDKVSKNIIGYAWSSDHKKVLIEYWSCETGELQSSYLLLLTTVPRDMRRYRLVYGTNGSLALVGPQQVAFLKNIL